MASSPVKPMDGPMQEHELTPRSKIKALLAAVDGDTSSSNDEKVITGKSKRRPLAQLDTNVVQKSSTLDDVAQDATNGDGPVREVEADEAGPFDKENTYRRVRQRLLRKKASDRVVDASDQAIVADPVNKPSTRATSPKTTPKTLSTPQHVRGQSSPSPITDNSESDLPDNPTTNATFLELCARKKAEREAREAREAEKSRKEEKKATAKQHGSLNDDQSEQDDAFVEDKLTQQSRPTRKASKKALEEMSRETQRMSRNMQLAHQAKTKKKISKQSLLARFNFATVTDADKHPDKHADSSTSPSSPPSDHAAAKRTTTPPTSPMVDQLQDDGKTHSDKHDVVEVASRKPQTLNPVAHSTPKQHVSLPENTRQSALDAEPTLPKFKMRLPPVAVNRDDDSENDLEIVPSRKTATAKLDAFKRAPEVKAQEGRSLRALRALAHLNSSPDDKAKFRNSKSMFNVQQDLRQRARQQAAEERRVKIKELEAKGIVIQTAEEKEMEQIEVEDLLEKARLEGQDIREQEKRAAKKSKRSLADGDQSNSEDDEDYQGEDEGDDDEELSGSSEEEQADSEDEEMDDANMDRKDLTLSETKASEIAEAGPLSDGTGGQNNVEQDIGTTRADQEHDESDAALPAVFKSRGRRNRIVIEDDEEAETQPLTMELKPASSDIGSAPSAVQVPRIFQQAGGSTPLGMTQAFAATIGDTQSQDDPAENEDADVLGDFGRPPDPKFPIGFDSNILPTLPDSLNRGDETADFVDSLPHDSNRVDFGFSMQTNDKQAISSQAIATQMSEIPDPTQDAGFVLSSPVPERFISEPPSTVDTVVIQEPVEEVPVQEKRRGRLQKGRQYTPPAEIGPGPVNEADEKHDDAFTAMKRARERAERIAFDKKKSEAKGMVEEQAEESEDEYAGLGGASDEDSGEEDAEFDSTMIDRDEVNVNERKLAALYADKQRTEDSKAIEKLFKDINNGGLRRKRNTEFDLSDSDDGGEARRRRKQREFAKMRQALLENENIGKIAEDPKKLAFMKAIEDRDGDAELDFLSLSAQDSFRVDTDTQEKEPSTETAEQAPQRNDDSQSENAAAAPPTARAPAAQRRTKAVDKRPTTLAEIRESVSFLCEDPRAEAAALMELSSCSSSSEDEADDEIALDKPDADSQPSLPTEKSFIEDSQPAPQAAAAKVIIDRLALSRENSTSSVSTTTASGMAFVTTSSTSTSTEATNPFRMPSLLRRATTSSISSLSSTASIKSKKSTVLARTERDAGNSGSNDSIRLGASTSRSSVNFVGIAATKRVIKTSAAAGLTPGAAMDEALRRRQVRDARRVSERRAGGGGGVLAVLGRVSSWD